MMMRPKLFAALAIGCVLPFAAMARSTDQATPALAASPTLLPVNAEAATGRILITLPVPDATGVSGRFLYTPSLRTGLGSAPTFLDRGKLGETQLLAFRRIGKKVAAVFENPRFRNPAGTSPDFATSIVWMGDIQSTLPDGSVVIDIAPFLTADSLGIARSLGQEETRITGDAPQGAGRGFRLDPALSAADARSVKSFPDNIEMEAVQTYVSDTPGAEIANIAPDARRVTFTVHHSFVRLPGPGFVPRRFDPRIGGFATQGVDYSRPLGTDVVFDVANRFRLEKTDPTAARSPVKKPIIFYVDPAAPEPIRSALIDGINWWGKAFDAAGYVDAFQAKLLPEGADPLDVRYNFVNWVDRATRGWSYGQEIVDPRTGEIVKGMVVLGSERVRQDIIIYQGLVGAAATGTGGPNDAVRVALTRLRELGAHEVGHSLGFAHNFAASTQDRASVMDYPGPRVGLVGGKPDLSDAYGNGVGAWDMATVDWLYGEPGSQAAVDAKAAAVVAKGLRYTPDDNARSPTTAQIWGGLWDDGADPVAELNRLMIVRRAAIAGFGLASLPPGDPVADLRRRFVPVYLLHRYQLVAAAKAVGGSDFTYAVAGGGHEVTRPAPATMQRAAIGAVLATIAPDQLTVPLALLPLLSSPRNGSDNRQFDIELFQTAGGPVFDPLAAADVAVELALNTLLAPSRLERLQIQHSADPAQPGVGELLDAIEARTIPPTTNALTRRIAYRAIVTLAQTARRADTAPEVSLMLSARVHHIALALGQRAGTADEHGWDAELSRQLLDPETLNRLVAERPRSIDVPPGDPIGSGEADWMGPIAD